MSLFQTIFEPMLLKEVKEPFNSKEHLFELKYDGIRALIYVSPTSFHIYSRHKKDITDMYPELKEIQKLVDSPTIFDGEIVLFIKGYPNFSKLQERAHLKNKAKIALKAKTNPVMFLAFDILYFHKDVTKYPLIERKKILNTFPDTDEFLKSLYIENDGKKLFQRVKELKMEGIVAKLKKSTYEKNTRSDAWVKIKNLQREPFLIGGFSEKENTPFFSIYIGEKQSEKLNYVGRVSVPRKEKLYEKIKKMRKRTKSPFFNCDEKEVIFVNPTKEAYIEYLEKGESGKLRHPVYRGEVE